MSYYVILIVELMRADCADLTEATVAAGPMLMIDQPDAVNSAIKRWLANNRFNEGCGR